MNQINVVELQNLTVAEIAEQVAALGAEQLVELRRLETEDGKVDGRVGVITLIDKAEADLAAAAAAQAQAGPKARAGKADAKAEAAESTETPDWQHPDYTGPLDIEKAEWRNRNLKPAGVAITK